MKVQQLIAAAVIGTVVGLPIGYISDGLLVMLAPQYEFKPGRYTETLSRDHRRWRY